MTPSANPFEEIRDDNLWRWCRYFHVSALAILEAVHEVGPRVREVRAYLQRDSSL